MRLLVCADKEGFKKEETEENTLCCTNRKTHSGSNHKEIGQIIVSVKI